MPLWKGRGTVFQSTRSAGSATLAYFDDYGIELISIHALRRERDLLDILMLFCIVISIHALRRERDFIIFLAQGRQK